MHGLETLIRINEAACRPRISHTRLAELVGEVQRLPVRNGYRTALLRSIDKYAEQIINRPIFPPEDGWDDLEALQQVTLGDMMEAQLSGRFSESGRTP
jgi:hypothetical protein